MSTLNDHVLERIDAEDWRKADGVTPQGTNSGLAPRDYSVRCDTKSIPIGIVKGYWIWWCSAHHQPQYQCERDKRDDKIEDLRLKLAKITKVVEESK